MKRRILRFWFWHVVCNGRILAILVCFAGFASSHAVRLQARQGVKNDVTSGFVQANPDPGIYRRIFDMAFPANLGEPRMTRFSLVLRFLPSFHPESQIVIRYGQKDDVSIDYMLAKVRLSNVILQNFANMEQSDVIRAAGLMDVQKKSLSISDETMKNWFHDLWISIAASTSAFETKAFRGEILLDGTKYILQYQEGLNRFSFECGGSEVGHEDPNDKYDLPLIKWMIKIRTAVSKLAQENRKEIR